MIRLSRLNSKGREPNIATLSSCASSYRFTSRSTARADPVPINASPREYTRAQITFKRAKPFGKIVGAIAALESRRSLGNDEDSFHYGGRPGAFNHIDDAYLELFWAKTVHVAYEGERGAFVCVQTTIKEA
jgi:hypothetical protein